MHNIRSVSPGLTILFVILLYPAMSRTIVIRKIGLYTISYCCLEFFYLIILFKTKKNLKIIYLKCNKTPTV